MNDDTIKKKIQEFLKHHKLCVIATVDTDKNAPESAVIGFAEKDNLELVFGTANTTRKYKNLTKNSHVSFVIGWDGAMGTVQYEGIAKELSGTESEEASAMLIAKNPYSEKFVNKETHRYFLVTPTWIRILDLAGTPPETYEITFQES